MAAIIGVSAPVACTCCASVAHMAPRRLPRGTRQHPVRVPYAIEGAKKERLDALARHAGVSTAILLERMIDHLDDELGEDGLPTWWPADEQQELPVAQ